MEKLNSEAATGGSSPFSFFARTVLLVTALVGLAAGRAMGEANYVYHEATTNNPGCGSDNYRSVLVPTAGSSLTVAFKVEYQNYTNMTGVYYTTDGSTPSGSKGVASGTTIFVAGSFSCIFNFGGNNIDVWTATIPASANLSGKTVKYIIGAWHSGGGAEIFANGCGNGCGSPTNSSSLATVFSYYVPYVVTTTADSGAGSLRQAITDANTNSGADIINFNIGGGGAQSITVSSALPTITGALTIDGTTQPGFTSAPLISVGASYVGTVFNSTTSGAVSFISLDASLSSAGNGICFQANSATSISITNCYAKNRQYGLHLINIASVTATGNDLTGSGINGGYALYLDNAGSTLLTATGNTYGGATTQGIRMANLSGKTIGDASGDIQVGSQLKEINVPIQVVNGSNTTITGLNLGRTTAGGYIDINGVAGFTLTNCTLTKRQYGALIQNCSNITITGCNFTDSGVSGGWVLYFDNNTGTLAVTGNTYGGATVQGISMRHFSGKTIGATTGDIQVGNQLKEFDLPVQVVGGSNITVVDLDLGRTTTGGYIDISGVATFSLTNCILTNRQYGALIQNCSNVSITSCNFTDSGVSNGWVLYLDSNTGTLSVTGNTYGGATTQGVSMRNLSGKTISATSADIEVGNQLKEIYLPIQVSGGSNITITGLDLGRTTSGGYVDINGVAGLTVTNNILTNRLYGLLIQNCSSINATGNDLTNSGTGGNWAIYLNNDNLLGGNISSNTIGGTTTKGVWMQSVSNATIAPSGGQINVGTYLKPLATPLQITGGSNITMAGLDLEKSGAVGNHIDINGVSSITVTNNILRNRLHGLVLQNCSSITATGNDLTNSGVAGGFAIYLNNDNLTGGNISSNAIGGATTKGVYMNSLSNATIAPAAGQIQVGSYLKPLVTPLQITGGSNITITDLDLEKTGAAGPAIDFSGVSGLTVTNNILKNRTYGLQIQNSSNVTATGNNLSGSGVSNGYVIYLDNVSGTLDISSNTFGGAIPSNGLYMNNMSNRIISDGSVSNTNVVIPDGSILRSVAGNSIKIDGGSGNRVENVDLENTGASRVGTAISVDNSPNFTATVNQIIKRTTGIFINNGSGAAIANLTCNNIKDNATGVVFGGSNSGSRLVNNNAIHLNTTGLNNATSPSQTIDATNNYWGSPAGPGSNGNNGTTGSNITTSPFAAAAPGCVEGGPFPISYTFTGSGNWSDAANWDANGIPANPLPTGSTITISGSGPATLDISQNINSGASLTVNAGKTFVLGTGTTMTNNGTFTNNGMLKGSGSFGGSVFDNTGGIIAPGGSPGCIVFSAGYNNGTGTEQIEIGGPTACTQHDQIQVTSGAATLSGTLDLLQYLGYVPSATESYTILTAPGGVTGTFSTINYPTVCGVTWSINYNANDVVVTATVFAPEIDVQGNSMTIMDGDNMPSTSDHTDFGNVAVNGSLVRTFTIFNTGDDDLTVASITSSNPTKFIVGALTPASPILEGTSATFTVTFSPTAGVQNATITVNNNDCDEGTYDFAVTGNGTCPATGSTWYVDAAAASGGNGASWGCAFQNLQDAINAASSGHEIWVKAGTYKPTKDPFGNASPSDPRDKTFYLKNGVKIYGGFNGTETALSQRDWVANVTTLSGDFNGDDSGLTNNSENAYHVAITVSDASTTRLDGFTVKGGNADGGSGSYITVEGIPIVRGYGGGLHNFGAATLVQNCTFTYNSSTGNGGGMYSGAAVGLHVTDCLFTSNVANNGGGALNTSSSPTFTSCTFSGNTAMTKGGGMANETNTAVVVTGCVFTGNSCVSSNGGGFNIGTSSTSAVLTNCLLTGNSAGNSGGGLYNSSTTMTLTNCTVSGNKATGSGGGLAFISTNPTVTNCLVWNNRHGTTTGTATANLFTNSSTPVITYSLIQNNNPSGAGNLNGIPNGSDANYPSFITQLDPEDAPSTAGNFHIGCGPAVNSGTSTSAPSTDLEGNARPFAGGFDMGAYERQTSTSEVDVKGNSVSIPDGSTTPSTANHTDFGDVTVGGSLVRTFTVLNTGNSDLTVSSITTSNPLFAVSAISATPISGPSGTATFTVTFSPTATGVQNSTITINNTDCSEAVYDFVVTGTGVAPGAALSLDGSNDYVNLGTSAFEFVGSFTIETWVNATLGSTTNFNQGRIMDKGVATAEGPALDLYSGIRYISADGGSGQYNITAPTQVPANTWSHIAVTIDVANLVGKIYYNGTLVKTQALSGDVAANPAYNLLLGATDGAGSVTNFLDGKLDEFRVWNRALCQNEIQAQMNCELTGSESGLMIYYNFNQGIAGGNNSGLNTVNDVATGSGHGGTNDGTLTNFALSGSSSNWAAPGGVTTGTSCPAVTTPEINLQGNATDITDGSLTPSTTDWTDFGSANFSRVFTIQNSGTAVLNISGITLTGANQGDFSIAPGAPATVAANGGSATFTVNFNPSATGARTATVHVNNDDCSEADYDFAISATAVAAKALAFDGADDYLTFPTTGLSATAGTISFWVNAAASQPNNSSMLAETGSENTAIFLWSNGSQIYFRAGGVGSQTSAIPFTGGSWKHVAMTWSGVGQTAKCYVDGVQVGTFTQTGTAGFGGTGYLGRSSLYANGTANLLGSMDDIRFWNRALCATEISQLMNCEVAAATDNLQVYFKCNQGYAGGPNTGITELTDDATSIGGANNGSFFNFALTGSSSNFVAPGGVTGGACSPTLPEIDIQGNSNPVADGSTTPSTTNWTDFGSTNFSRTFTIYNSGSVVLNISGITLTGTNSGDFNIAPGAPATVAANGGSATFTVNFNPMGAGARAAVVHVNNDDCDEADYDFAISATGVAAKALHFDGVDDYVSIPHNAALNATTLTAECWFKTTATPSYAGIINKYVASSGDGWMLYQSGSNLLAWMYTQPGSISCSFSSSGVNVADGNWHHVAATFDATGGKIYIDGTLRGSGTWGGTPGTITTTAPVSLGWYNGATPPTGSYFQGSLDEVRIWNYARPQSEIQATMNTEIASMPPCMLAYYKLNSGFVNANNTGLTTAVDAANSNADDGALNNFALTGATSNWVAGSGIAETASTYSPSSEINLTGNSNNIADGSTTPSATNWTDFGSTNFSRVFTIQNSGTAVLNISSITLTGTNAADFSIAAGTPTTVAANGGSATFTVNFSPTAAGARTATVHVNNDDCDEADYDFAISATGVAAKALHVDGSGPSDNVNSPSFTAFGTEPATIEFWAKNESSFSFPVGFGGYLFLFGGGNLTIRKDFVADYNTGATVSNTGTVWEHFALTYDGAGTWRAYKNGLPTPTPTFTGFGNSATTGTLQIGEPKGGYPWTGTIDEVRMWKEQRTDAQIYANFNTEIAGMDPCLTVYWKMNQGFVGANNSTVTTATDAANAVVQNGTLTNFALTGSTGNWVAGSGITEVTSAYVPAPEIDIQGNATGIADGASTASTGNWTDFGSTNFSRTFTIFNTGNLVLNISSITLTGTNAGDFSIAAGAPTSVAMGGSAIFTVNFAPTAAGVRNATIHVFNDDCDEADYDFAIKATGVAGAGLDLGGSSDFVSLANTASLLDGATQFTIEHWINSDGGSAVGIVGKGASGCCTNTIHTGLNVNGQFFLKIGNQDGRFSNTSVVPTGSWVHLAVVYDGTQTGANRIKLYANGVDVSGSTFGTIPAVAPSPGVAFAIGAAMTDGSFNFNGKIDEVRIWNRVLCQPEIQAHMNCELAGTETGLQAYYKFNQGFVGANNSGVTSLTDASGNSRTGTLTGFALSGASSNWTAPGGVTTGTSCSTYLQPEINLAGNSVTILDGSATPSTGDWTDFGSTNFSRVFTIQNSGTSVLNISSITLTGTNAADFSIAAGAPTTVAANGGSATFTVNFNPSAAGARAAVVHVNNSDCDEADYDFAVSGTGVSASALNFDGVDDHVVTALNDNPNSSWTMAAWIYPTSFPNNGATNLGCTVVGADLSGSHGNGFGISPTQIKVIYNNGWTNFNYNFTANNWYHVAVVTNVAVGTVKAFVNGTLVATNPVSFTLGGSATVFKIGYNPGVLSDPFAGIIDEVRLWNSANTCEILAQQSSCEVGGTPANLQGYYKFNQGFVGANNSTVTTLANAISGGPAGTLTNFALNGTTSNWTSPGGVPTGTSCPTLLAVEADVKGGSGPTSIVDGDITPSTTDGTDFGSITINTTTSQTFTIANTGNATLNVSNVTITGTDASNFSVFTAPASTVAASGTTTFTIQFAPTTTGVKNAVMHVNNDDCDEADYDIAIRGAATCIAPSFTTCPGNQSVNVAAGTCANTVTYASAVTGTPAPSVTYSFSGATTNSGSGDGSGSTFNKGVTAVTLTAASGCAPDATCSFTVTVADNIPPDITCSTDVTINMTANQCTGTTVLMAPTISDNCAGTLGNALNYAPNDDEVTAPATGLPTGNAARTVEFWVKITNTSQQHIVSWGNFTCAIYPFSGVMRPHLWGSNNDVSSTALTVPLNQWTHVAYVLTGTQMIFYVNGIPDAKTYTHNTQSGGNLYVGSYFGATGQTVDEVRIWNVARTQAQIQNTMGTELVGNEPGLVSYYKFNQGSAGNNNSGITTLNATTGQNGTLATFTLNGATSNWVQGLTFPLATNNALSSYPKGTTAVTWTATDASGNTTTCVQNVTVVDNQVPVLTAPSNQTLAITSGCTATYTIVDPISDNCTGATWGYTLAGATTATVTGIADVSNATNVVFNKGVTTVTLTGVDAAATPNNAVPKNFTVTVNDPVVPAVTACFGTNIAAFGQASGNSITQGANSVYQSFTAPQTGVITSIQIQLGSAASGLTLQVGSGISCGGTVLGSKAFNGVSGLQTITFDTPIPVTGGVMYNFGILGNHTAGWNTAGTYSGGQFYYNGCPGSPSFPAADLVFTVNMNYVPPISLNVAPGTCAQSYSIPAPTISDNCSGPLTWNATFSGNANGNPTNLTGLTDGSPSGDITFNKGATSVVLTAVDAMGNVSTTTCPFTVTVVDNIPPDITCATDVTINTTAGLCTGMTTLTSPTVTDNCSVPAAGNALNFDGVNDNVSRPALPLSGAMTIEAWIRPTALSGLVAIDDDNWVPGGHHFQVLNNQIEFSVNGNSPTDFTAGTISANTWTHVAITYDKAAAATNLYLNGSLTATLNYSTAIDLTPQTGNIGSWGAGRYFPGSIDELRVWNVVRTQAQIAADMNNSLGAQSGLLANYTFNQGTAGGSNTGITQAISATGACYNGTLSGFALTGNTSNFVAGQASSSLFVANNAPCTYPIGNTTVTWTATDASGNTKTCQQTVTVTDNEVPVLTAPGDQVLNTAPGTCAATYTIADPISDNCTGSTWGYTLSGATTATVTGIADGSDATNVPFNKGVTSVTLTGVDAAGVPNNAVPKNFTVTVTDNLVPTISGCPSNQTVNNTLSLCTGTYNIPAPTLMDNCPTITWSAAFSGNSNGNPTDLSGLADGSASGNVVFQKGVTNVVLTAVDAAGLVSTTTCPFTVTVLTPQVNLKGNNVTIPDGNTTTSTADDTDFGQTPGGTIMKTFTIENLGTPALHIPVGGITFTDPSGFFSVGGISLPATIAGGSTTTFTVTYAPSGAPANHTATVHIANDDCEESDYDFAIKGENTCLAATFTACPSPTVTVTVPSGGCDATATYTATANGNPAPTFTYAFTGATSGSGSGTGSGSTFNVGTTSVTVTATNPCSAPTCTFDVVVLAPDANVQGGSPAASIPDGTTPPASANGTDFGRSYIGTAKGRVFTIQNLGTSSLTVSGITFTGTNAGEFSTAGIGFPATIAANGSTTFTLNLTAAGYGTRSATVHIANDDCNEADYDFDVQGNGGLWVTTTADAGAGSLRQAITDANTLPGADVISFDIAPGGAQTITVSSDLPALTGPTTIDGTTQPGYSGTPLIAIGPSFIGSIFNSTAAGAMSFMALNMSGTPHGASIRADGATSLSVSNCIAKSKENGIWLSNCANVSITGTDLTDAGQGNGYALNLDGCTASLSATGNTFGGSFAGIFLKNMTGTTVGATTGNIQVGAQLREIVVPITVFGGSNITITDLDLGKTTPGGAGPYFLSGVTGATVTNCISTNRNWGANFTSCSNVTCTGNNFTDSGFPASGDWALHLESLTGSLAVSGNTFGGTTETGILMQDISGKTVGAASGDVQVGTQLKEILYPLKVANGSNITVTGIDFGRTVYGGFVECSSVMGITVTNCSMRNRLTGLSFVGCSGVTATGNDLTDAATSGGHAIYLQSDNCAGMNISGNTIGGTTVHGLYMEALSTVTVGPASGQIQLGQQLKFLNNPMQVVGGSSVTVTGLQFETVGAPGTTPNFYQVAGLTITNCTIKNKSWGLKIEACSNVTATGNDLTDSGTGTDFAIYLYQIAGTLNVSGNTIGGATQNGLRMESVSNYIVSDGSVPGTNVAFADGSGLGNLTGISVKLDNCSNITVQDLDLENTGATRVGTGVYAYQVSDLNLTVNQLIKRTNGIQIGYGSGTSPASITCNNIRNNDTGVYLWGTATGTTLVNNNAIWQNNTGINNATAQAVDATNNWWGSAGGPGAGGNNGVNGSNITTSPYAFSVPGCVEGSGFPAIYTFLGTVSGEWPTPGNWQGGVVPTTANLLPGDVITIAANCSPVNINLTMPAGCGIVVNPGKSLTLNPSSVFTLGANSEVYVDAGAGLFYGTLVTSGQIDVYGQYWPQSLTLNSGSVLNVKPGGFYNCPFCSEFPAAGSTITNDGTMWTGTPNTWQCTFNNNAGAFFGSSGQGSQVMFGASSVVNNRGMFQTYDANTSGIFTNFSTGTVTMPATGFFTIKGSANFQNQGLLSLPIISTYLNLKDNAVLNNTGTFKNNGFFYKTASSTYTNNGVYMGSGTMGGTAFTNFPGGIVAPGNSPGCATFSDGFSSSGTLNIELGGLDPCGAFDRVVVTGTASLDAGGTLNVTLYGTPPAFPVGTALTILQATTRTGTFDNVSLPPNWFINYLPTSVVLTYGLALPTELVDFHARKDGEKARLDWMTATEASNKGWEIERSAYGHDWLAIGFVAGKGTTSEASTYTFWDAAPFAGLNYYRLRQIDLNGTENLSKVETVNMGRSDAIEVYPNPVSGGELTVILPSELEEEEGVIVRLFDAAGRLVIFQKVEPDGQPLKFDLSELPDGVYGLEAGGLFKKVVIGR